jgi:hypothetical protein
MKDEAFPKLVPRRERPTPYFVQRRERFVVVVDRGADIEDRPRRTGDRDAKSRRFATEVERK